MVKRIVFAVAALFLMLGLTAAPAHSDQEGPGEITLYELTNLDRDGDFVEVPEAQVPTSCSSIPAPLTVVRSAFNETSITVAFFTASDTSCNNALAELGPGKSANIAEAGRWMAVSS